MWCLEWKAFSEQPEYCDWVQMGSQYSNWCMTEEFLLDQGEHECPVASHAILFLDLRLRTSKVKENAVS